MAKFVVDDSDDLFVCVLGNQSVKEDHFPEPKHAGDKSVRMAAPLRAIDHLDLRHWHLGSLGFLEDGVLELPIIKITELEEAWEDESWDEEGNDHQEGDRDAGQDGDESGS